MTPRSLRPIRSLCSLLLLVVPLAAQAMPKPQVEHQRLLQSVGTWDATIDAMGIDGKVHRTAGVSVQRVGPGGFWLLDDFQGEMNGVPFTGHGALGYDPQQKAYVQSWVSMTPMLMMFRGTFDATGRVLTMTGDGPGLDGNPIRMKNVTTWTSADSMTCEIFVVLPDGAEHKNMTITYTRRVEPHSEHSGAKK